MAHRPTHDPSPLAVAVATLTGNLFLLAGTFVLASAAVLLGWIPPRGRLIYGIARLWAKGVLAASWVSARPQFETPLDPCGQYVFMANHSSLFDIPGLLATLPGQTRFLAKKSLFQIPIFGWALKMGGFITIDRKDLSTARDSFSSAIAQLDGGVSVLIFPEGTRSPGDRLLPFKRGGFLLALKSGLPIVPVGLVESASIQKKRSLWIRPRPLRLHYGSPIAVEDYGVAGRRRLTDRIRHEIERLRQPRPQRNLEETTK